MLARNFLGGRVRKRGDYSLGSMNDLRVMLQALHGIVSHGVVSLACSVYDVYWVTEGLFLTQGVVNGASCVVHLRSLILRSPLTTRIIT